ncbi:MAG: hypothetical protein ABR548_11900 [Actinomycetota bacterium]
MSAFVMLAALSASLGSAGAASSMHVGRLQPAPAPAWFTRSIADRVLSEGSVALPAAAQGSINTSSVAFLGIRPGQLIILDDGKTTSLCTANFVFYTGSAPPAGLVTATSSKSAVSTKKPSSGTARVKGGGSTASSYYIGTAGHCGKAGTQVDMVFLPAGIAHIGQIVKSTGDPGDRIGATDFALISIDPSFNQYVSPSMAYWGGPTGVYTPPSNDAIAPVLHAGWGLVIGTGGTPRAGLAYKWNAGSEYRFEGAVTPGDSGSGAIVAGGLAAGNITHIAVDTRQSVPVWNGGTTMAAILQYLGTSYHLATCPTAIPWPLPGCPPV